MTPMNTTSTHTNLEYLRLMADGDRDMEQTMLEMLITELTDEFEKMKGLLQEEQWEDLGRVSHKMKSTLAFIGNDTMTNANLGIEQAAKHTRDLERVPELVKLFGERLPDVVEELRGTLKNY